MNTVTVFPPAPPRSRELSTRCRIVRPSPAYGDTLRSSEQFEPRRVLLDSEGCVITGKLPLNRSSVVDPTLGIVCQDNDAVSGRWATDDEVVRIVVEPPLPPVKGWAEFDAPTCAPGELAVNAPERLPTRIVKPENVGQEQPVVGSCGQKRPVAMETGFWIAETALFHAERSEDPVSGQGGDRHTATSLEVLLEQDEAFAGIAPALARWAQWLERLATWAPVRKPSGVSEHVAYRYVIEDGLIEVPGELERQVRDDLFDERCGVHHGHLAIDSNELPVAYNGDGPTHACSRYAYDRPRPGVLGHP